MGVNWTDDERTDDRTLRPGPDEPPGLVARIAVSKDHPAECTLYPGAASEQDRLTTWLTAKEGSFVSLDDMR